MRAVKTCGTKARWAPRAALALGKGENPHLLEVLSNPGKNNFFPRHPGIITLLNQ